MDKNDEKKMLELLKQKSKHSQYQRLPSCLEHLIDCPQGGKYEKERMDYICDKVNIRGNVLDIGGNTGYFTFESITRGNADHVDCYEGNEDHAEFVRIAAEYTNYSSNISVFNMYFTPDKLKQKYDYGFFLNVVHHLGKDYESGIEINEAKRRMIDELNAMSYSIHTLLFQIGFNWGGNVESCLFEKGTKIELINFISEGTKNHWKIRNVGIAIEKNNETVYEDLCNDNLIRMDRLGEFRNRPLFILESKCY